MFSWNKKLWIYTYVFLMRRIPTSANFENCCCSNGKTEVLYFFSYSMYKQHNFIQIQIASCGRLSFDFWLLVSRFNISLANDLNRCQPNIWLQKRVTKITYIDELVSRTYVSKVFENQTSSIGVWWTFFLETNETFCNIKSPKSE